MTHPAELSRGPAPRRALLWRHGRTEWNLAGRFQGQTDVPLDDVGRAQARRAAALVAALRPDRIVSSDLSRAVETATALARHTGLDVTRDPGLRETGAGSWEGLRAPELASRFPDDYARWRSGDAHVEIGGGESRTQVAVRMAAAVQRAVDGLPPGGLVVIATHGGSARLGIAQLIGLPPERVTALGVLANCCWSVLVETVAGWQLVEHNAGTLPEPVTTEEG